MGRMIIECLVSGLHAIGMSPGWLQLMATYVRDYWRLLCAEARRWELSLMCPAGGEKKSAFFCVHVSKYSNIWW